MNTYIFYIELMGIIAFSISGAMEAIKNKFDFLGVIILGIVTATGGGIIRDIVIGIIPPLSFRRGLNIYLAIISSIVVFLYSLFNEDINNKTVSKVYERALVYTDAIGLGVFTITSMQIAYGVNPNHSAVLYVFVGVISGIGGGIIRDLLTDTTPYILQRHVYASASLVGSILFHLFTVYSRIYNQIIMLICISIVILIRLLAYHYKWNLPKATKILD